MSALIGRDSELAAAARWLADETEQRMLLVNGAPGIGKTVFLHTVTEAADARGHLVLKAQPASVESDLSFAGLGDLLDGGSALDLTVLPEPQRIALEVALLLRSPETATPNLRAVGAALLNVLKGLTIDGPVLVAIDDVQWLDQPSASAIRFVARRLRDQPVRIAITRRTDTGSEVRDWIADEHVGEIELGPLTLGATHALVLDHLGIVLRRPVLRRIHELSRGNPLHALELGRAYASGSIRFEASTHLPLGLEHLVATRVQRLPEATRTGLAAAAAASSPTIHQLSIVLETDDAMGILEPALAEGVVELSQGHIRFTHPLLASAAYSSVQATTVRALHSRLAAITDDPDESARHLAHSIEGPDELVAAALERAADNVFRRGAPFLAAGLAELARDATPSGEIEGMRRRNLAEADYRFEAGDTHAASDLITDLISAEDPGPKRAALLSRLARYQHFAEGLAGSTEYLHRARSEAGDDSQLRFHIEEGLAWNLLLMRSDLESADAAAQNAVQLAEALGDRGSLAEALAVAALTRSALGGEAMDLMERALGLEPATLSLRVLRHPSFSYGSLLTTVDRLEEAHRVFDELIGRAEASGDESALPSLLLHTGLILCLTGEFGEALARAEEAAAVASQDDQIPSQTSALGRVALIHARLGAQEPAEAVAEQAIGLACPDGYDPEQPRSAMARGGEMAIWAMGLAAIFDGRPKEAARLLYPMSEVFREAGYRNPGEMRFLTDTMEALAASGSFEEAHTMVRWMETMPVQRPGAAGTVALAVGLLAAEEGELPKAQGHLIEAVEAFRLAPLPFELGRALLAMGKVQRRSKAKSTARRTLEEAAETFERLGSHGWAKLARDEGRRVGGARSGTDGFTETELRVAELIAAGLSNKDVASQLFISRKTVEAALTRLYAKIGIKSRTELVRWVMERQQAQQE